VLVLIPQGSIVIESLDVSSDPDVEPSHLLLAVSSKRLRLFSGWCAPGNQRLEPLWLKIRGSAFVISHAWVLANSMVNVAPPEGEFAAEIEAPISLRSL
jgi:hypothetical protein